MIPSAYVHVPFCRSICSYCAFERTAYLDWISPWLERICIEIRQTLEQARKEDPDFFLETVYIGGGTPSVLSPGQLDQLLSCFDGFFDPKGEWTLEANPDSVDETMLSIAKKHGVNRLSIGIQSFHDERLTFLGRRHTVRQGLEAIKKIQKSGPFSLSIDLMYGFAGQSLQELEEDLQSFLALKADHLSIYSLIIEPETLFARDRILGADEEQGALLYEFIEKKMEEAGYEHYEVSSYARNQKYGRHNLLIWQDGLYFGFGFGAVGRDEKGLHRFEGTLGQYVKGEGQRVYEENETPWFDALMTGLRTSQGVNLDAWNRKYHRSFLPEFSRVLERYPDGLQIEKGFVKTTRKGREILDSILVDFLMEC